MNSCVFLKTSSYKAIYPATYKDIHDIQQTISIVVTLIFAKQREKIAVVIYI